MEPSGFDRANGSLGPPKGMSEDEVRTIRCWRGPGTEGRAVCITCWKPTKEELEEINRTGRVWLHVFGTTMMPSYLGGHDPFEEGQKT